jgi:hypothetical protein
MCCKKQQEQQAVAGMIALSIGPTSSSATAFARSTAESRTAQGIDFQDRIEDADLGSIK